uniref:hypothetical protein n=1 Tax=Phocaeicola vulgatus TaxID=821 RepID=UPI003FEF2574
RPPAPKAGALTGLRYTPNLFLFFNRFISQKRCKGTAFFYICKYLKRFFSTFFRIITYQIINQNINLKTFFIRNKEISV